MNAYVWRKAAAKYCCSYTGSDEMGDGSQEKPYKKLVTAVNAGASTICCRGIFNDNPGVSKYPGDTTGKIYYGDQISIYGDYYGAAVWDGQGVNVLYGFYLADMIVLNSSTLSGSFVGVGCANIAGNVGYAVSVVGLAGSPALLDSCGLYWGILGGTTAVNNIVYSNPKPVYDPYYNSTQFLSTYGLLSFGSYAGARNNNLTVHNIPKVNITRTFITGGTVGFNYGYSLFTKTAIYLDQSGIFDTCLFSSDCTFWRAAGKGTAGASGVIGKVTSNVAGSGYAVGDKIQVNGGSSNAYLTVKKVSAGGVALATLCNEGTGFETNHGAGFTLNQICTTTNVANANGVTGTGTGYKVNVTEVDVQFIPTGATDGDKMTSIVTELGAITGTKATVPNSVYTSSAYDALYNNADKLDYTLKTSSAAIIPVFNPTATTPYFYGALKPALNVPIKAVSDGTAACWDNNTMYGDMAISNNSIVIDDTPTNAESGIMSKVVVIDSQAVILDGFKSLFVPFFNQNIYLEERKIIGNAASRIGENIVLPVGKYIVCGTTGSLISYTITSDPVKVEVISANLGRILTVLATDVNKYYTISGSAYVVPIYDPNVWNPIYVRMQPVVYLQVGVGTPLLPKVTYLNGSANIAFLGRTIVAGESFTVTDLQSSNTGFTCADAGYKISVVFDDNETGKIVAAAEWIPALAFDAYFNRTNAGAQIYSSDGKTYLTAQVTAGSVTTVTVANTRQFPESGTIQIGSQQFPYTSKTLTTFVNAVGQAITPTIANGTVVTLVNTKIAIKDRPASAGSTMAYVSPATSATYNQLLNKNYLQFKIVVQKYDV